MTIEQTFQDRERTAAAALIAAALHEDLDDIGDLTCRALINPAKRATVNVVARKAGVLAGTPIGWMVFTSLYSLVFDIVPTPSGEIVKARQRKLGKTPPHPNPRGAGEGTESKKIIWTAFKHDGDRLAPGDVIAAVSGPLDKLLIGERTMLNFLTHLSGIATLTRRFVDAVAGTKAVILDTRKTHPGYRLLEKYAVRCGGGTNHRMGLYDGVLIKDNHLAAWTESASIADAVRTARAKSPAGVSIEVEVDTLDQLRDALAGEPDIVLLDNMDPATLRQAVAIRDAHLFSPRSPDRGASASMNVVSRDAPSSGDGGLNLLLEESGGVTFDTIREIALTGVDRISIGALTHSAPALDLAFDWSNSEAQA